MVGRDLSISRSSTSADRHDLLVRGDREVTDDLGDREIEDVRGAGRLQLRDQRVDESLSTTVSIEPW